LGTSLTGLLLLTLQGWSASLFFQLPFNSLEALSLVFLGAALWFQARHAFSPSDRKIVVALALPPFLIGLGALAGIHFLRDALGFAPALSLVLVGLAAALPDFEPWPGSRPLHALLMPVIWASILTGITLAYGTGAPNFFNIYTGIPAPLALAFILLIAGILLARPEKGILGTLFSENAGGAMARLLIPLVAVAAFIIGWLRIHGIRHGYFDNFFGYSQFAATNLVVFSIFIWISARVLNRTDAKRRLAMEKVQEGNLELTRVNASLEARIRQHYVAEEARKKAEMQLFQSQKMEALGTLASGIAHDFNNILTIILLNSDLARESLPEGHAASANLAEIGKAGNRAAGLIRQIMTFGQRNESELRSLRIEKVVESAVSLLRSSFPPGIQIEAAMRDDIPAVNANPSHIEQVLINLGANAAHAMGATGTLRIELEPVTITTDKAALSAQLREGRYARITVSDSGHGMDPTTLKKIFDPFFTTKAPGEGTGLGLSVVHGILKLHGGAVTVYSEPGRGTVFSLYFPATTLSPVEATPAKPAVPRGKGERILCVDDDDSLVAAVSVMLENLGYVPTVHLRPIEALEDFRAHPGRYDLVLTDFSMPGMSGLALARALTGIHPGIPIIMMSGYLGPEDAGEALRAGIQDVILKPDVPEKMGEMVSRALAARPRLAT